MTIQDQINESKRRLEESRLRWANYEKDLARKNIEHKMKLAQNSIDFWTASEEKYRNDPTYYNPNTLIRFAKHKRKAAKADLDYWRSELKKFDECEKKQ